MTTIEFMANTTNRTTLTIVKRDLLDMINGINCYTDCDDDRWSMLKIGANSTTLTIHTKLDHLADSIHTIDNTVKIERILEIIKIVNAVLDFQVS